MSSITDRHIKCRVIDSVKTAKNFSWERRLDCDGWRGWIRSEKLHELLLSGIWTGLSSKENPGVIQCLSVFLKWFVSEHRLMFHPDERDDIRVEIDEDDFDSCQDDYPYQCIPEKIAHKDHTKWNRHKWSPEGWDEGMTLISPVPGMEILHFTVRLNLWNSFAKICNMTNTDVDNNTCGVILFSIIEIEMRLNLVYGHFYHHSFVWFPDFQDLMFPPERDSGRAKEFYHTSSEFESESRMTVYVKDWKKINRDESEE